MVNFSRITQLPDMMGGKPCIRGIRVTVGMIVAMIGSGLSIEALLADYPYLEREDILEALRYAAWRSDDREVCDRRVRVLSRWGLLTRPRQAGRDSDSRDAQLDCFPSDGLRQATPPVWSYQTSESPAAVSVSTANPFFTRFARFGSLDPSGVCVP